MRALEALQSDWPMATEIRKLESRVWRQVRKDKIKTILVTSALQGEGKSTTLALLAVANALHQDRRILAIDLDFRRPRLQTYFDAEPEHELGSYLIGEKSLEDVITPSGIGRLDLVFPALYANDPHLAINSPLLNDAFEEFSKRYDLILVDAPAIIPVPDTAQIIPLSDGILLSVMAGKSTKPHLSRARELCAGMGANIMGIVVGNIQEAAPEYLDANYYERYSGPPKKDDNESPPDTRGDLAAES